MAAQPYEQKTPQNKKSELYILNEWTVWHIDYISIRLFKKDIKMAYVEKRAELLSLS